MALRWRIGRRRSARATLLVAPLLLAALATAGGTAAHALLRASQPAAGATLGSAPDSVLLTFGETPDLRLTTVKVLDSGGQDHTSGPLEPATDPPDSVRVPLEPLADGAYTVSWRTVSAVDGHLSAGSFAFGVGVAPPTGKTTEAASGAGQSGSPAAIGARWILYLGLVALIGAAFAALAVARRPAPDLLALAAAGWLLAVIGTVGVIGIQWAETGAPLEELPATSIGLSLLARVVALGLVGVSLVALAVVPRLTARVSWLGVGVTSSVAILVDVATGHAAAGPDWLSQTAVQALHGVAAATWVGGLLGLLILLRTTPPAERLASARRYSAWAGWALAAVAATGVVRAIQEVGSIDALLGTDFGRVVVAKSVGLMGLASLGALNRFVTLRDAARVASGLRRLGGLELTVGAVVLGLSGWLVNLTPPTSAGAPTAPVAQPIIAVGHDFGTSVKLRLVATPGAAGQNDFEVALVDYDTGAPVDATAVKLRFELASQSGVGPSTLELHRTAAGQFQASGANLSIDGIWRVTATVTQTGSALEVPLVAVTTVPAQPFTKLESADVPTIYTVQLGVVGSAQVYLDPDSPGANELHVTFFDPAGIELPIEAATIAAAAAGGGAEILAPRLLEPGHFVADVETVPGQLVVDAIGPLPDGTGQIHLHVTIEVTP